MKKFDIAGRSKVWFIMSLLVIIPGIFCMFTKGFNFGIDFTGGTIIDMKFEQPVSIAQVRASLAKFGLDGATIQLSGAQSDVLESQDVMVRAADMEEDQRKEDQRKAGMESGWLPLRRRPLSRARRGNAAAARLQLPHLREEGPLASPRERA